MSEEAAALIRFHEWADTRRQQRRIAPIAAFYARYLATAVLMTTSSGCIALARTVAPAP